MLAFLWGQYCDQAVVVDTKFLGVIIDHWKNSY